MKVMVVVYMYGGLIEDVEVYAGYHRKYYAFKAVSKYLELPIKSWKDLEAWRETVDGSKTDIRLLNTELRWRPKAKEEQA